VEAIASRSGEVLAGVEKPGFFEDLGGDGKMIAETRFLVFSPESGNER